MNVGIVEVKVGIFLRVPVIAWNQKFVAFLFACAIPLTIVEIAWTVR